MKIKSITIEGMHNVVEKTYTFDNLNYLYGPNGAGKSTALQAIQLALLGYIPGVDKKNEALLGHAKGKMMSVTCVLDDKGKTITVSRSLVGSGKNISKQCDISPEGVSMEDILADIELPVFNFSDFLGLTSNKMKEWFINFLPNSGSAIDWKKEFEDSLGDKKILDDQLIPDTLAAIKDFKSEGVEYVRDVNNYMKELTSLLKGNLQRTQATIQSLVFYDDCDTDMSPDAIRSQLSEYNDKLAKAAQVASVKALNASIHAQLDAIKVEGESAETDSRYADCQKKLAEVDNKAHAAHESIKAAQDKQKEISGKVAELNAEIRAKQSVISGKGICPYIQSECSEIKELISRLEKEVAEMYDKIADLKEADQNAQLNINNGYAEANALKLESNSLTAQMNKICSDYAMVGRLKAQLQMEELIDGEELSVEDIKQKIANLQSTLSKVEANAKYNSLIDSLTAEKYKVENSIEVIKIWNTLTGPNGLQTKMMTQPFDELVSDMNVFLQKMFNKKDITAHFVLSEKANSFSFGLMRSDKYIAFEMLSSGEKCMYTLALMMCIVSRSASSLKVIMIDDLLDHLDDANATKLFDALYKIKDIQIILAGVKACNSNCRDSIVIEVK